MVVVGVINVKGDPDGMSNPIPIGRGYKFRGVFEGVPPGKEETARFSIQGEVWEAEIEEREGDFITWRLTRHLTEGN